MTAKSIRIRKLTQLLVTLACCARSAGAAIQAPVGFAGKVSETKQQALMFHDGKNAHLVVTTSLSCPAGLPPTVAWVIPLPSMLLQHETLGSDVFAELERLTAGDGKPAAASPKPAPQGSDAYRYRVKVIRLEGQSSAPVVNRYLSSSNFQPVPEQDVQVYLRPEAVFVVVYVEGLHGATADLPPLHLTFDSDVLTVPLRSSAASGVFDLTLYAVTPQRLPITAMRRYRMFGNQSLRLNAHSTAKPLLRLLLSDPGFLTRFSGDSYNTPGRFVHDFDADPTIGVEAAH